ncbi:MAG: DUF1801 domain-containing protein [Nanoarchaeales archaeon]|nr:DUF1801 domain-containing protein [Nanoarchaeales archaeon]
MNKYKFKNKEVEIVFNSYPKNIKLKLLEIREIIFETASKNEEIGEIEETLRWGEPTYLTTQSKSGSMIRLAFKEKEENKFGIYFHCQTTLVSTFKEMFPKTFTFEGNRCLRFNLDDKIPKTELENCISQALTYNL